MLLQTDTWSCGVYAIVNACLALGHDHTKEIAQIRVNAGTTRARGTNEVGVVRALQELQYSVQELQPIEIDGESRFQNLWISLRNALDRGCPAILCVDGVDHWVAVVGGIGFGAECKLLVFDSQRDSKESGLLVYDEHKFKSRLGGSRYALTIGDLPEESDSVGRDATTDVMASVLSMIGDTSAASRSSTPARENFSAQPTTKIPAELADWLLRGGS